MASRLDGFTPVLYDHTGKPIRTDAHRYDDMAVPTVVTFSSILRGGWETFWHGRWDEAMKKGREYALSMNRDARLEGMLQERYLAVSTLKWHLEVEDDYDPAQVWVKDHLTRAVSRTPHLRHLITYLLRAVWYGRYGSQIKWQRQRMISEKPDGTKVPVRTLVVKKHFPVNGDKIGHHFDHTPYVLVHHGEATGQIEGHTDTTYTTEGGLGLLLRGSWRDRFIIHSHLPEDADFFDADGAEAIHGVGLRSKIFWLDWLRQEWMSWVIDYMERVGLGVTIYFYESGNAQSKAEAERAAHEQSRRSVILAPFYPEQQGKGGSVQRVETPTAGAQVLLQMIQYVDDLQNRMIIGQTLSSDSEGSGLGGTGVAMLHAGTKQRIVQFDAENLGESLTRDFVDVMKRDTFPWADFPVHFRFDVEEANPEATLSAISMAMNVGLKVKSDEVRSVLGLSTPSPDDDVLDLFAQQNQMQQMQQGGQPGQPGQDGGQSGQGQDPYAALLAGMGGKPDQSFDKLYQQQGGGQR